MEGRLVPPIAHLCVEAPWWSNFFENITLVQFQHRMIAYLVLAVALAHAVRARVSQDGGAAACASALAGLVLLQASIGVVTLLFAVPLWAGLLHQATAMLVLGMAVGHRPLLAN